MQKIIREYSIPLILGVVTAIICANVFPQWYHTITETPIVGEKITLHWLVNDIFMVLFFASAGIEIVNSVSPGGPLNSPRKAATPLFATAGGVLGPIGVFFLLNAVIGAPEFTNGWGITTATDIALAWLIAKIVFGKGHPAVSFLLLLAVVDDAIGLAIIAIFYPDPSHPVDVRWLGLVIVGMLIAYALRKKGVTSFWPYILIAGTVSWIGMYCAYLHPALAFVFIVPFLPHEGNVRQHEDEHGSHDAPYDSTLSEFEHKLSPIVDYGLFFFGFANAGVAFSEMSNLTWIILIALIVGKTLGITVFTFIASKVFKFGLPKGMENKDVIVAGIIAGMGLTVALFVSTAAFTDGGLQGAAKMGALFTVIAAPMAIIIGKVFKIKKSETK